MPKTDETYTTAIAVALRVLAAVDRTMTYGELAKAIGLWNGIVPFRHQHNIGRLLNKTADLYRAEALQFERIVNAQTRKPGPGFYVGRTMM